MDLQLSEDQELFWETTSKFLESTCPLTTVREWATSEPAGFPRSWWSQGAELGWISMLVADEHGGGNVSGNGVADLALISEEFGRKDAPGPLVPVSIVAAALSRYGSDAQRAQWLDGLVAGESFASWAIGRHFGLGATSTLQVTRSGDSIVLNGTLSPVEASDIAGVFLVSGDIEGVGVNVLVPADSSGLSIQELTSIDLVRRFGTLTFDNVTLGAESILAGDGDEQFFALADIAAVLQSAALAGMVDLWLGLTIEYAFDRHSFGRPLASYQALKHRFAQLKTSTEAALATSVAAAEAVGLGAPRASEFASVAKAYTGDLAAKGLHECVQLNGGIATTWDHDLHLHLRRAVQDTALYGTPEEHRERLAQIIGMGN